MYIPPAFREHDIAAMHAVIDDARLANLVTHSADGLIATPLPLLLDRSEGSHGTLYGHVARANPQWQMVLTGEAMVIFMGADAYVTPSWYATKRETGKVVPTWNYIAVHAYGVPEFFTDNDRLLALVTRLTNRHEAPRAAPWAVSDAPAQYIQSQLRGIVGFRLPITRLEGKRKMSQNRSAEDRAGVIDGLAASENLQDRAVADLVPRSDRTA